MTELQKVAATKFIKTYFGDKNGNFDHLRPWLMGKINNNHISPSNPLQKGCPDIIPGLKAQPWWYENQYLGTQKTFLGLNISNKDTKISEIS